MRYKKMEEIFDNEVVNEPIDNDYLTDALKDMAMEDVNIPNEIRREFNNKNVMDVINYHKFNELINGGFEPGKFYGIVQSFDAWTSGTLSDIAYWTRNDKSQCRLIISSLDVSTRSFHVCYDSEKLEIPNNKRIKVGISRKSRFVVAFTESTISEDDIVKLISDVNSASGLTTSALFIDYSGTNTSYYDTNSMSRIAKNLNIAVIANYVLRPELASFSPMLNTMYDNHLFNFIEESYVCLAMDEVATQYGIEIAVKSIKNRVCHIQNQNCIIINRLYTERLENILRKYDKVLHKFSDNHIFSLSVDDKDGLEITEQCDGYYSRKLSINDCYDLSEVFKKLGDELSFIGRGNPIGSKIPKQIWFSYDKDYVITKLYTKKSDIKFIAGMNVLETSNPDAIEFLMSAFENKTRHPIIVFPERSLIIRHPMLSYGDIISFKDVK